MCKLNSIRMQRNGMKILVNAQHRVVVVVVVKNVNFRFDLWQPWTEGRISTATNTQSKSVLCKGCKRLQNAKFSV